VRIEGRRALCSPLEPFFEAARDMLASARGAPDDALARTAGVLVDRLGLDPEDAARLLDRLASRPSRLRVTPDIAWREEVAALRSFFGRALAAHLTALVVEDADALDPASLGLVKDLLEAAAGRGLSLVVTARADPWPEWRVSEITRLNVAALELGGARTLLADRLAGLDVPEDLVELVMTWAKGSPLMLELFAQGLLSRGRSEPPASAPAPVSGAPTSEDPRALVETALRGAGKLAQRWMRCAALVGPRASIALLAAWAPPGDAAGRTLRECAATGLVRVDGEHLVYRNQGVRELVGDLVAERDQREIHRFVAAWSAQGEPPRAPLEVVAAHLEAAGDSQQAGVCLERAASELMDRDEPRAAAILLAHAGLVWMGARDGASVARVGIAQAEALLRAGDGKGASDALARLERVGAVVDEGLRARVFATIARLQSDPQLALGALTRASDAAIDTLDQLAWFRVESDLASLLEAMERDDQAEVHAALAHELAMSILDSHPGGAALADTTRLTQSAASLAMVRVRLGRQQDAKAVLQRSLEAVGARDDVASRSRVLANLAFVAAHAGDLEGAAGLAASALEAARAAGDRMAAARVAINGATYAARLGRRQEARGGYKTALALSRAIGWKRGARVAMEALSKMGDAAAGEGG
jgi:tetratricopeptide (TPR) repeat protein